MTAHKATDNGLLSSKLALRRWFLRRYHAEHPPRVIDCCQGSGVIWSRLSRQFRIALYTGFDLKPKAGRLRIDSARFLAAGGWDADVVDVDTYGHPWKHLDAIYSTFSGQYLTVFLTIGSGTRMGGLNLPEAQQVTGLATALPKALQAKIEPVVIDCKLGALCLSWRVVEAREAPRSRRARYIGLRLQRNAPAEAVTPAGA